MTRRTFPSLVGDELHLAVLVVTDLDRAMDHAHALHGGYMTSRLTLPIIDFSILPRLVGLGRHGGSGSGPDLLLLLTLLQLPKDSTEDSAVDDTEIDHDDSDNKEVTAKYVENGFIAYRIQMKPPLKEENT